MTDLSVSCYSGHAYAERPLSFRWRGEDYPVLEIVKAWREPGRRCFRVRTRHNKTGQLCYNEAEDRWSLSWLTGKEEPDAKGNTENPGR